MARAPSTRKQRLKWMPSDNAEGCCQGLKTCKGHRPERHGTHETCQAQHPEPRLQGRGEFRGQGIIHILRPRVTPSVRRDHSRLPTTSLFVQGTEDRLGPRQDPDRATFLWLPQSGGQAGLKGGRS